MSLPVGKQDRERDRTVRKLLVLEGSLNILVLALKAAVGLSTGSLTILGDALHSLSDVFNNVVALVVMRLAEKPPDREHPYGHRKFETLAVLMLACLLTVLAFEIALRAIDRGERPVEKSGWTLAVMIGVLFVNFFIAIWQGRWAKRLDSDILYADARHTLADVLTTIVVIIGWQLASRGYPWLDSVFACVVALFVLYLALGLFQRVVPVLTDHIAHEPEHLREAIESVEGVSSVLNVRSRGSATAAAMDVVITVDPNLTVVDAHAIADEVENDIRNRFDIHDITVHVEPA